MIKRLLLFAIVLAIVYWIVKDQPTVSGFVDRITSPLLGSKAAVQEAEHNRVVNEAAPAITSDEERRVGELKLGMRAYDVRELFGEPDVNEPVVRDGRKQAAWTYRRIHRVLYMEDSRVVEILIR